MLPSNNGRVRLFKLRTGDWVETRHFEGEVEARYGASVSLAGDGATLAIGAPDANGGGLLNGQTDVIELVSSNPPKCRVIVYSFVPFLVAGSGGSRTPQESRG